VSISQKKGFTPPNSTATQGSLVIDISYGPKLTFSLTQPLHAAIVDTVGRD